MRHLLTCFIHLLKQVACDYQEYPFLKLMWSFSLLVGNIWFSRPLIISITLHPLNVIHSPKKRNTQFSFILQCQQSCSRSGRKCSRISHLLVCFPSFCKQLSPCFKLIGSINQSLFWLNPSHVCSQQPYTKKT